MKPTRAFFEEIKGLIHSARATVARGVDLVQVYTNFEIGRRIVQQEQKGKGRAEYGQEVLTALSDRLVDEFGRGYSRSNLEYMRKFFLLFEERSSISQSLSGKLSVLTKSQTLSGKLVLAAKGQTLSGESAPRPFTLNWSHYVFLLGVKNPDDRSFYEIESAAQDWTVRELKRQFDSSLYERLALSRDKKGIRKLAREGQIIANPADLLKEPLVLEFLGLHQSPRYSESDLETALINHLAQFLLELGKGFLFEARQRRFTFDREIKRPEENPTIGIVLCRQKNKAIVEITLPKDANIHASEYQLYLPSKEELQRKLLEWGNEARGGK